MIFVDEKPTVCTLFFLKIAGGSLSNLGHPVRLPLPEELRRDRWLRQGLRQDGMGTRQPSENQLSCYERDCWQFQHSWQYSSRNWFYEGFLLSRVPFHSTWSGTRALCTLPRVMQCKYSDNLFCLLLQSLWALFFASVRRLNTVREFSFVFLRTCLLHLVQYRILLLMLFWAISNQNFQVLNLV